MNNTDSNTGEIVMYELTNVKLLFITKDYLIILWRLNNCLVSLPHQKRAQTCWTKGQALIDKLLITRNKLVKTIERIEELLR